MIPSVDDRIGSMIRAMEGVVLPALQSGQGLAEEQASLVLGHLHQLRAQLDLAPRYEFVEHRELLNLANRIIAAAKGGSATIAAADTLKELSIEPDSDDAVQSRDRTSRLSAGISRAIAAAHQDGDPGFMREMYRDVLAQGERAATRDRSWFLMAGFDGPSANLPSVAQVLE